MGTPTFYNAFKLKQHNGNAINLASATIKAMIVTSGYAPSLAHAFKSDITSEVSGTNYTARGIALSGVTIALDGNTVEFACNDITITQSASGFTNGRTIVFYEDTGSDATSKLIAYQQETSDFGNVTGDLILDGSPTTGIFNFG